MLLLLFEKKINDYVYKVPDSYKSYRIQTRAILDSQSVQES
jgi:hypothetical protein